MGCTHAHNRKKKKNTQCILNLQAVKSPSCSDTVLIIPPRKEPSEPHLRASRADLTATEKEPDSRARWRRVGRRGGAASICVWLIVSEIWGMLIGDNVLRGRYGPRRRLHNGIKEEFIIALARAGRRGEESAGPPSICAST